MLDYIIINITWVEQNTTVSAIRLDGNKHKCSVSFINIKKTLTAGQLYNIILHEYYCNYNHNTLNIILYHITQGSSSSTD